VARRSGALSTSAYYVWSATGATYASGGSAFYEGGAWTSAGTDDLAFSIVTASNTINGGSATITDSDAWGVVGFALIGTTVAAAYVPRHPAHDHGSVTIF
jgi:hypothetical protein